MVDVADKTRLLTVGGHTITELKEAAERLRAASRAIEQECKDAGIDGMACSVWMGGMGTMWVRFTHRLRLFRNSRDSVRRDCSTENVQLAHYRSVIDDVLPIYREKSTAKGSARNG